MRNRGRLYFPRFLNKMNRGKRHQRRKFHDRGTTGVPAVLKKRGEFPRFFAAGLRIFPRFPKIPPRDRGNSGSITTLLIFSPILFFYFIIFYWRTYRFFSEPYFLLEERPDFYASVIFLGEHPDFLRALFCFGKTPRFSWERYFVL